MPQVPVCVHSYLHAAEDFLDEPRLVYAMRRHCVRYAFDDAWRIANGMLMHNVLALRLHCGRDAGAFRLHSG